MIPPLPNEQHGSTIGARHKWVNLLTDNLYTKAEVRKMFMDTFGREPDRCYSPEESVTDFWWLGWVTHKESLGWVELNREGRNGNRV